MGARHLVGDPEPVAGDRLLRADGGLKARQIPRSSLRNGFAVLTGEDAQFHEALSDGADGGILASAHIETETFARIRSLVVAGQRDAALSHWRSVADLTRLLFSEPSPAPIKYWLWRTGLIDSAEVRLPMTQVSAGLSARLDLEIPRRMLLSTAGTDDHRVA